MDERSLSPSLLLSNKCINLKTKTAAIPAWSLPKVSSFFPGLLALLFCCLGLPSVGLESPAGGAKPRWGLLAERTGAGSQWLAGKTPGSWLGSPGVRENQVNLSMLKSTLTHREVISAPTTSWDVGCFPSQLYLGFRQLHCPF